MDSLDVILSSNLSLSSLLFPTDPALWACPIQQGIPFFIELARNWLIFIAALAFIYGVIAATFLYLTAFGDENKAKKGKETIKWTFIGAIVFMLSGFIIHFVVSVFATDDANLAFNEATCQQADNPAAGPQEIDRQFRDSGIEPGLGSGGSGGFSLPAADGF